MGAALGAEQMVEELTDRNLEPEEKIECMSMYMTAVCITDLVVHELREHGLELCGVGGGEERRKGERRKESGRESKVGQG